MNLQALYDLKERLEHAAIAGTGLMHEGFRLRRAAEALAPLAKANPVFAKISAGAAALLNGPEEMRSTKLLELLSLVDAVVYTQGVINMPGSITEPDMCFGTYVEVSYGQLQPLLTALGGTGSGRTSLIREYWSSHPAYFSDFRVLPHVVAALGDNYGELADLIGEILVKQGEGIIPLLKENFDPAGKTEMVRRIRIIAKLAGEKENQWFLTILPDSKKDIRETLIQALSLSKENNRLLLDLCQSERGKLKEAAMRALAAMDTEEAAVFWKKEIQKKPNLVACLKGVGSILAADLASGAMGNFLEKLLKEKQAYDQADLEQLTMLSAVLSGKSSADVESLWCWISERMEAFSRIVPDKNVRACDMTVAEHLQKTLMVTILSNSESALRNLARDLGQGYKDWFLGCAMLADMAEMSAGELYDRYSAYIMPMGMLQQESESQLRSRIQVMQVLAISRWNQALKRHCIVFQTHDAMHGLPVPRVLKLDGVDPRWMTKMTDPNVRKYGGIFTIGAVVDQRRIDPAVDEVITGLVDPENPEVCRLAGKWFYEQMMKTGSIIDYFPRLQLCRWKEWKGVLAQCAKKKEIHSYDMVISMLRRMPMTNLEKADELKQLDLMADRGGLKVRYGKWPKEWALRQIALLESDPNAEL